MENGTSDTQEGDGHNNSFSLGTGHGSILKSEEGKKKKGTNGECCVVCFLWSSKMLPSFRIMATYTLHTDFVSTDIPINNLQRGNLRATYAHAHSNAMILSNHDHNLRVQNYWRNFVAQTLQTPPPLHSQSVLVWYSYWPSKFNQPVNMSDRLCGLVVRVSGYRSRGPAFDSRSYQIFWEVGGLEWGLLSLVRTTEELLEWKSSGSGLENRD
jgi:hypothetical protein